MPPACLNGCEAPSQAGVLHSERGVVHRAASQRNSTRRRALPLSRLACACDHDVCAGRRNLAEVPGFEAVSSARFQQPAQATTAEEEATAVEDEEAGEEDEEAEEDEDMASVADAMSLELERGAEGGEWVSAPARYLQGLLWVVQMYVRGECPDYR